MQAASRPVHMHLEFIDRLHHRSMIMALAVGIPVVVVQEVQQQVDGVDVESSPPALQLHNRRRRRSANYQPSTWDYDSICSSIFSRRPAAPHQQEAEAESSVVQLQLQAASFKDSVRRLLLVLHQKQQLEEENHDDDSGSTTTTRSSSSRLIRVIHQLQSLGVAYHFHQDITGILLSMYKYQQHQHLDLHSAALLFRMQRQLGIPASTDMLMSALMREEGDKVTDSDALLALYQASYLAFPGETVLDQARAFAVGRLGAGRRDDDDNDDSDDCTTHLPSTTTLPLHWTAPRLQAMWSLIKDDDDDDDHNNNKRRVLAADDPAILQLARLDFNLVQALHRRELAEVTRWWKESRLGGYSFARDRVVECFFCAACIAPEPRLAECREVLAKIGALIVHLDDIYDVHGTMDELQAFTDAIASWEHGHDDYDTLPEYMKAMYSAIWTTSVTAADGVLEKHGHDMLPLYKKAWHELCKAFLVEAQWQRRQGHMPSFADYVSNGWVTSTGPLLLLHALPAAGIIIPITKTQANGAGGGIGYPRLVELSSTIFRLCNDCASHEAESERGDAPSSIACYMAEPWCAGEEQARAAVQGVIAETWRALNWEVVVAASGSDNNYPCCCPSSAAETEGMTTMANLCLNLARIIHCIYQDGDGITSPTHRTKQMVKDLLFNPSCSQSSS